MWLHQERVSREEQHDLPGSAEAVACLGGGVPRARRVGGT